MNRKELEQCTWDSTPADERRDRKEHRVLAKFGTEAGKRVQLAEARQRDRKLTGNNREIRVFDPSGSTPGTMSPWMPLWALFNDELLQRCEQGREPKMRAPYNRTRRDYKSSIENGSTLKHQHATKKTKKTKTSSVGARYPFGGTVGPGGYRKLHDPGARVVYRVINPSTGIQHEFDNKAEALEKAATRAHKERGQVAVEQGTMTSAGIFRYDLDPQTIWSSEWRSEAESSASRHHATKKSPAQLQREIDDVLAKPKPGWQTRVFNTHHAAQGFLNRIKKQHVAVIEEHGPSQWRVAYLPEGKGMPLNK